jgi:hypothetical protein
MIKLCFEQFLLAHNIHRHVNKLDKFLEYVLGNKVQASKTYHLQDIVGMIGFSVLAVTRISCTSCTSVEGYVAMEMCTS